MLRRLQAAERAALDRAAALEAECVAARSELAGAKALVAELTSQLAAVRQEGELFMREIEVRRWEGCGGNSRRVGNGGRRRVREEGELSLREIEVRLGSKQLSHKVFFQLLPRLLAVGCRHLPSPAPDHTHHLCVCTPAASRGPDACKALLQASQVLAPQSCALSSTPLCRATVLSPDPLSGHVDGVRGVPGAEPAAAGAAGEQGGGGRRAGGGQAQGEGEDEEGGGEVGGLCGQKQRPRMCFGPHRVCPCWCRVAVA